MKMTVSLGQSVSSNFQPMRNRVQVGPKFQKSRKEIQKKQKKPLPVRILAHVIFEMDHVTIIHVILILEIDRVTKEIEKIMKTGNEKIIKENHKAKPEMKVNR